MNVYDIFTTYNNYFNSWSEFASRYNRAVIEAASESCKIFLGKHVKLNEHKKIRNEASATFHSTLGKSLCDEDVSSSLAKFVDAWLDVVKISGYDKYHSSFSDYLASWRRTFDPFLNKIHRTPSELIKVKDKFHLHHYKPVDKKRHKTPLLVIYSLINRYYILDLMPHASVINNLQNQGFDVYTTFWGSPDFYDKDMRLVNYAHDYVGNAVNKIKEISGSEKVSLFGYCWGGIFALIYAASHPENVKNLVLHAAPVDMSQQNGVIENWAAHLDVDRLVDTLGNVPGLFVNLAFILRNPVEPILKYLIFFSEPHSLEQIQQFFWIETWLYDNKPIIGETFRDIVNKISKKNLLIKNEMELDGKRIDLSKMTTPILNIFGSYDDLVPPESCKSLTSVIGSKDKKSIEFPTGHVGLCISQKAHEKLWPEVGKWLAERS